MIIHKLFPNSLKARPGIFIVSVFPILIFNLEGTLSHLLIDYLICCEKSSRWNFPIQFIQQIFPTIICFHFASLLYIWFFLLLSPSSYQSCPMYIRSVKCLSFLYFHFGDITLKVLLSSFNGETAWESEKLKRIWGEPVVTSYRHGHCLLLWKEFIAKLASTWFFISRIRLLILAFEGESILRMCLFLLWSVLFPMYCFSEAFFHPRY